MIYTKVGTAIAIMMVSVGWPMKEKQNIWRSKMAYMMTRKTNDYMDELFNDMFGTWGIRNSSYPTVNVYEDSKAFYVEAELPGYVGIKIRKCLCGRTVNQNANPGGIRSVQLTILEHP